jgi:uncharacterized protein (TIRG00374 family)
MPSRPAATQPPDSDVTESARPVRSTLKKALAYAVPAMIAVALLVGVLPALADFTEVRAAIGDLDQLSVALLLALAAWNILTYQFLIMAALPGLPLSQAFMVGQISTAVSNTIPAGAAVGVGVTYALFTSFGYGAAQIGIAAALTGLWNTFVKLGLPIVALAILAIQGNPHPAALGAALAGLLVLLAAVVGMVLVVRSDRFAGSIGVWLQKVVSWLARPFRRGPFTGWDASLRDFRARTADVLQRRWVWLTLTALLSHLSLFVLLVASLRAVGVSAQEVSWAEALAAFASVRLVTALPITPGGIGLVEVGMTGALVLAGGGQAEVVAGVLVFRVLSYAIQVPIGAVCWVWWRATARKLTAA